MRRISDKDWDLTLSPETIRELILKARAVSAGMNADYEDGAEHEVELDDRGHDTHHHDGLAEEEIEDLTARELRAAIRELNEDEAAELVALMWIGRGDFEPAEFRLAVEEAKGRSDIKPWRYLLDRPLLGEWLEDGLQAIGA
ncbi:DUF3775 domain-containing protein [Mesorhizobium australicum]|uniref:DUF3775 domain-containing protein n=1 Tax=Mesorhizobium australicum TaxID=536018 RepID=A0A1X7PIP4_9HYPH|nr:DUF3775 domain-containing protein [Mesorhizobium australicum]SMH51476.1 Protein of unknown function [Mesorhizobium australicum]